MEEILHQLIDGLSHFRVSTMLLVVQDFATIHSITLGYGTFMVYTTFMGIEWLLFMFIHIYSYLSLIFIYIYIYPHNIPYNRPYNARLTSIRVICPLSQPHGGLKP